jgi:xylulokinase
MGVMLSAAGSLQWYRDAFAPGIGFEELVDEAASVPAGSEGLLFLPYLSGERTPHPDPLARGAFVGLTTRHSRAHLTRALLEGVAFGLRDCFELLLTAGIDPPRHALVAGGGARSALWRQIISDVLGIELTTVAISECGAFGAALLAGVGAGVWSTVGQACSSTVTSGEATQPIARTRDVYESSFGLYRELYPALTRTNEKLSALAANGAALDS